MRLVDVDPIIERLQNAINLGKRIGCPTEEFESVLADIENQPIFVCKACKACDLVKVEEE